jgi:alanine or glycine:cation symporter, AGCS family
MQIGVSALQSPCRCNRCWAGAIIAAPLRGHGAGMDTFNDILGRINGVLWHDFVLYAIVGVGILFTVWSAFSQYYALKHGTQVIRGKFDQKDAPGAINHFQALSAALSATVGLGNIGGVAVAIALGGPGAVFWMWVVGLLGMAIKTTEVTLAMLYRNTDDPDNPHGGPMWVAKRGFAKISPALAPLGAIVGGIFCITLLVSTVTGGNMFQAWNVAIVTEQNFGVPQIGSGILLSVAVGAVIIGGIKRIGSVAGRLVPMMCGVYMLAAIYVVFVNIGEVPAVLKLIVRSAFSAADAQGAFIGGTAGYAFLWGMKRALFSNEAGQGSSPIAHSAAKTNEPVREGVVAGLEPFIDTIVVCTLTSLVILTSGAWNRGPEATLAAAPQVVEAAPGTWQIEPTPLPSNEVARWVPGAGQVFMIVNTGEAHATLERVSGTVEKAGAGFIATWSPIANATAPRLDDHGVYGNYAGAALTSHAFDRVTPGLGKWLVTIAAWLFALSTMISWSYYGEQGMVYLLGQRSVMSYRVVYCTLIIIATAGFITTDAALDNLTGVGTGVMLFANIPIMLMFGKQAMTAYHAYIRRLRTGEFHAHPPGSIPDVIEGKQIGDDGKPRDGG